MKEGLPLQAQSKASKWRQAELKDPNWAWTTLLEGFLPQPADRNPAALASHTDGWERTPLADRTLFTTCFQAHK
jgi:hypothetical protein